MYDHFSAVIAHGVKFSKCSSKLLRKLYDFSPKTTTDVIFWFSCLLKINSAITVHTRRCMDSTFLADTDSKKKQLIDQPNVQAIIYGLKTEH